MDAPPLLYPKRGLTMELRKMTGTEPLYVYRQSQQISQQTGFVGYLRGDYGPSGKQFFTTWFGDREDWNTPEFKHSLQRTIDRLRYETKQLADRDQLSTLCLNDMSSAITEDQRWFGFRVDSGDYAFLLKCSPCKGDYNFYVYCYRKDWLDQHMAQAQQGIRFIDPCYNEQFRIPDGGRIRITKSDSVRDEYTCRFVDESHVEIADGRDSVYHICQFAELMERNGNIVEPVVPALGEQAPAPSPQMMNQIMG